MDESKLNQLVGQMLGDLGGALSVPLVRIGDRLGLYKALYADGPMTPGELATKAKVADALDSAFRPFVQDGAARFTCACWMVTARA